MEVFTSKEKQESMTNQTSRKRKGSFEFTSQSKRLKIPGTMLIDDLLAEIFSFATKEDLQKLIFVNKQFYRVFKKLEQSSLDSIRIDYLNGKLDYKNGRGKLLSVFDQQKLPSKFVKNINEFKKSLFKGKVLTTILDVLFEENKKNQQKFVVAGGSVLGALMNKEYADIDIFLLENGRPCCDNHEILRNALIRVDNILQKNDAKYGIVKNSSTLTIITEESKHEIQFIFRRVSCLEELLCFFDLDCCRFAFDGTSVYTVKEGLRSIELGYNLCSVEHIDNPLYFKRAVKYSYRGFNTYFVSLHPLLHLLNTNTIQSMMSEFEDNDVYPKFNNRSDSRKKHETDVGLYTAFASISYNTLKLIHSMGVREYLKKLDEEENEEHDSDEELLLNYRNIDSDAIDQHHFCLSFKELFNLDYSIFYKEGYFDSHLWQKYKFVKCYICEKYFKVSKKTPTEEELECDYDFDAPDILPNDKSMCFECKKFNNQNKTLKRDLKGQFAIITGARIKIGYETALILLRNGATVIGTTRFIANAHKRYQKEKDYEEWKDRLILYPLNLKDSTAISQFISFVKEKFNRVHILINNAAQTIRRPILYYKPHIEQEAKDIQGKTSSKALVKVDIPTQYKNNMLKVLNENTVKALYFQNDPISKVRQKSIEALFNQLTKEDFNASPKHFPTGIFDNFGEPVDLRKSNSWTLKPTEITTTELFEVQMINNLAPTILATQLLPLMKPNRNSQEPGYIINVTSNEGQFSTKNKNDSHFHTNMSKAALNMLTRSASSYYARHGILMNSVDTGWISSGIETWKDPPLDCKDGAFRVLYPILSQSRIYGQLWKNYKIVDW